MNCPSRVDPEALPNGWNQNPGAFDLQTNNEFSNRPNLTQHREQEIASAEHTELDALDLDRHVLQPPDSKDDNGARQSASVSRLPLSEKDGNAQMGAADSEKSSVSRPRNEPVPESSSPSKPAQLWQVIRKFSKFVGPGFMVAVAYIDPGNYATDVAAGATYRFELLVMILVSNIIAIFLQSLCIKLGSVTGLNLAENIKRHCPPWLNYILWFFAEAAIIATDIAEVLGTAIALKLLIKVPLVAGCAISIVDVLIILIFYRPSGSIKGLRFFEVFVIILVLGVVICFCIELSLIEVPDVGQIFRGYLPSHALIESQGLYQACGILGATVMPHSLYLGSGIVQPRLKEYDLSHGIITERSGDPSQQSQHPAETSKEQGSCPAEPQRAASPSPSVASAGTHSTSSTSSRTNLTSEEPYRPSLAAIKHCMTYSIVELSISLATFALFVNSAILIVAGATLYGVPDVADASLFSIHDLFSHTLAPFAGTVFALALLLSGTSAGIVCTIAGQMVSEGQLGWSAKPWVRRLVVRSISITPSIIVAGAIGESGVSAALEGTQVALSVILPFVSAPLVWFTCRAKYMKAGEENKNMRNSVFTCVVAVVIWLIIVVMNIAALVLVGLGEE